MRIILGMFLLLLTGCSTLWPSSSTFPVVPKQLMEPPKELIMITEKEIPTKLSEVTKIIIENYNISNENSLQLKTLQTWVTEQELIFNK